MNGFDGRRVFFFLSYWVGPDEKRKFRFLHTNFL